MMQKLVIIGVFTVLLLIVSTSVCAVIRPGNTTITLNKSSYEIGDTVYVSLEADSHHAENEIVDYFNCYARYYPGAAGAIGSYAFEGNVDAQHSSGYTYTGAFQFVVPNCEEIHIYACAVDSNQHASSSAGEKVIYIQPQEDEGENNNSNYEDEEIDYEDNADGTPGFELIITICSLALILFWRRKRMG